MADIDHTGLTSSQVHEPKHITDATTSDNGKVITPSSSTDGESSLESLEGTDIASTGESTGVFLTADGDDTSSWGTVEGADLGSNGESSGKVLTSDGSNGATWEDPTDNTNFPSGLRDETGTTYTFVLLDDSTVAGGKIAVTFDNASSITATIPPNSSVAFPTGATINCIQKGAGELSLSPGSGVTIQGGSISRGQYRAMSAVKIATDTWYVFGGS